MPFFVHIQCDPALLPEPNHVMLNHLYALSIKVSYQVDSITPKEFSFLAYFEHRVAAEMWEKPSVVTLDK